MFKTLLLLSLLGASNVLACPDLSGTFTCALSVGNVDSATTQSTDALGITTYKMFNGNGVLAATWKADGQVRETSGCSPVAGPGCFKIIRQASFTCIGSELVAHELMRQYRPTGELSFTSETINKFSINSKNERQTEFIEVNPDGSRELPKIQVCTRKQ